MRRVLRCRLQRRDHDVLDLLRSDHRRATRPRPDAKIIAVPATDPRWAHIQDIGDVPTDTRDRIEHFFTHYKDLEPSKYTTVDGWDDQAAAHRLVDDAYVRAAAHREGGAHE